ncbi:retrotransposon protein, putative, Ty1-copia subclass [Cucumis melo var. makuwa]|uniref:Retrotransposon protein, putative, Ty1-copia subclass n=1 Tax=Cucumis melo var. makuwa TaxID=1194695 RepID=A0A5D3CPY2_CUCMM|nr:retrotransposon protein, putative, Ty1-copia subclass [Cucumis melo var. makuwa]TYK13500.1 retrotransposon protein, putative, Ty1-copia subclass [Cucumis melo var. makuwa]
MVNSKFDQWVTSDLLLLGWIYNSMTAEVAFQLMGFNIAKDLWEAIQDLFGVQSRVEEDFLRHGFQTTRKGNSKMEDYLRIMKTNVENLGQEKPDISWLDMQSELLIFEKRLEHQNSNKKSKGHTFTPSNSNQNLTAFVTTYNSNSFVTPETVIDSNWYVDNGATNHVTADYSNLSNPLKYSGIEHVIVGNAQDNNVYLEFHGDYCFVNNKDTGRTIMRGVLKDGLYHLESVAVLADLKKSGSRKLQFKHINKNASTFLLSKKANGGASKTVWHRRLSHPQRQF